MTDFRELVASWHRLSPSVRETIMELVRTPWPWRSHEESKVR